MNNYDEKRYICEKCDFASNFIIYFKKHSCIQHQCKNCKVKFKSNDGLNNHACVNSYLQKHLKSSINIYKCTECGFSCRSKGILKLHKNVHFVGLFKCSNCDFVTNFVNIYIMHLENCDENSDSLMKRIKKNIHSNNSRNSKAVSDGGPAHIADSCSVLSSKTISDNKPVHTDNENNINSEMKMEERNYPNDETQDCSRNVTKENDIKINQQTSVVIKKNIKIKNVEEISTSKAIKTSKNKSLLCPFCFSQPSNFGRHIRLKHKTEPAVAEALKLPLKQQIEAFAAFRRRGPKLHNADNLKLSRGKLKPSHSMKTSTYVRCKGCHKSYIQSAYKSHENECPGFKKPSSVVEVPESLDFNAQIKAKFRDDEVGKFIKGDELLLEYGTFRFQNWKTPKKRNNEFRRNLMITLRRLGCLCISFKNVLESHSLSMKSSLDLFKPGNFSFLMTALDNVTDSHPSSKLQMAYRLKAYAKFVQMSNKRNETLKKGFSMNEFFSLLKVKWKDHFEYSKKSLKKKKGKTSEKVPLWNNVHKIRNYIINNLKKLDCIAPSEWNLNTFVLARRIIVCRLIFLNVPRMGEPLKLTVKDWEESKSNTEIDQNSLNNADPNINNLFKSFKVIYQRRKNQLLFPLLIPKDCLQTIDVLSNMKLREKCGIKDTNKFLFPSSHSNSHVFGWSDISYVCKGAKVVDKILINESRDKAYEIFENLEIPKNLKEEFYTLLETHQ